MSNLPSRKNIRLKDWDYSSAGMYFITICTEGKRPILGEVRTCGEDASVVLSPAGECAERILRRMPGIDHFIIMPNHIHFLVMIPEDYGEGTRALPQLVRSYKACVSRELGEKIWQRGYYEHVIRNSTDYLSHVKYIVENPLRWVYDKYYI